MNWSQTYDSMKQLKCCDYPDLNSRIGVVVSEPFDHKGLNKRCVDVSWETVSVNTMAYGNCGIEANNWKRAVADNTKSIIEKLEATIEELEAHKARLQKELLKLPKGKYRPRIVKAKQMELV